MAVTFAEQVAVQTAHQSEPAVLAAVGSDDFVRCASYAVWLGMQRGWVDRRNETFTFLDADTVRRRMSVDFTLTPATDLRPGEVALVPLMLLKKEDLRNLDVRDAQGAAVPVMTTSQDGAAGFPRFDPAPTVENFGVHTGSAALEGIYHAPDAERQLNELLDYPRV